MNTYPTTPTPRIGSKDTKIIPIVKSESEGNYTKVRRVTTKARMKFNLKYNTITSDEFNTLDAFFEANQGIAFIFVHPVTSISYNCIFNQSELGKNYKGVHIDTDMILEEV
jgi:hypothetical protein